MNSDLDKYKQEEILKLRQKFNSDVSALRTKYNKNVANIRNSKNNPISKRNSINVLTKQLQNRINALRKIMNTEIAKINLLLTLPSHLIQPVSILQQRNPDKFALLVGINYIGTGYQLSGCINDSVNIKNLLETSYNYKSSNITMLTDFTTNKPDKKTIIETFTNMLQNSISGDYLFFQYSGHGSYILDNSSDEKDGRDETIVTIDFQEIMDDDFRNIIVSNLKPGVKLFALFDSCHSGTVLDLRYNYFDSDNFNNLTINDKIPETSGQVIMISGCLDKQTSEDAAFVISDKIVYQGAMTNAFIKSLTSNILLKTLLENMRTTLKTGKFSQLPQLSCGIAINVDDQVFDI